MGDQYATVAQVKTLLSVKPNTMTDVGLIEMILDAVTVEFQTNLSRSVLTATYDEVYDGQGTNALVLPNFPITAVSTLEVGPPTGRTTLTQNTDYVFNKFGIQRLFGKFGRGVANIHVVYTAGYASVPLDLSMACAKTVAYRYKQMDRLGQSSKTMGQETVNFINTPFTQDVLQTLQQYQRRIPV